MRIRALAVAVVLPVLPVFADPAPQPPRDQCSVTFVRAPERVRREVEKWVRAEPRCSSSIELRVVPTDGGFYLFARDDQGRIRERVVPDAQSVGVLVASWIADDAPVSAPGSPQPAIPPAPSGHPAGADPDDVTPAPGVVAGPVVSGVPAPLPFVTPTPMPSVGPAPTPAPTPSPTPSPSPSAGPAPLPSVAPTPCVTAPPTGAPGALAPAPATEAAPGAFAPAPAARVPHSFSASTAVHVLHEKQASSTAAGRWLTLGGTDGLSGRSNRGLRAELDVLGRRWWTAGIAATMVDSTSDSMFPETSGMAELFLSGTMSSERWSIRAQVSGGAAIIRGVNGYFEYVDGYPFGDSTVFVRPMVGASLLVSRKLGNRWAITAGPIVNSIFTEHDSFYQDTDTAHRDLMLFAGLRHRL